MSSNPSLATAAFRLSLQQERAWSQHERGVPQFAQCFMSVEGVLDETRLHQAFEVVVSRYEILRTRFRRQAGIKLPFQVIAEDPTFHFEHLSGNQEDLVKLLLREQSRRPNLEEDPSLRAVLVTINPLRHSLILTLPAFSADAATLRNLAHEIGKAYGHQDSASDVMQYADLVEWQNELLASDETKAGRDYWRSACRSLDFAAGNAVSLPLERNTGAPFRPDSLSLCVASWQEKLTACTTKLRASDRDLLFAAWSAVLARIAGQKEVMLGAEFDGRRYQELETALGPLARCLPLPTELRPELPFRRLLETIQHVSREAENWQESFAWTQVSETEFPALPFSFSYHDLGGMECEGGVQFRLERLQVVSEPYKLRLVVLRREAGLELEFHYDAARLEPNAIERIAGYYQRLVTAALENLETAVGKLPLVSEMERRQLVVEWNQTTADYPKSQCLHQLFEEQAARTPERLAVRSGERVLFYRELNECANQLAHYLRRQGVGPNRPVGVCLERSSQMMVAVLAVLKAGGAYVPLNPDNPPARLEQQLDGAAALITQSMLTAQMPKFAGPVIVVDRDRYLWAKESTSNPQSTTDAESLVYVIYTSGSTGVPKGVAVRHRNLVNYADFISKRLSLDQYPEGLEFATVSTLGADLGNTCIYPALISGGCLHVVSYEVATDPRRFAEYLSQHPVDVLKIVPSHLQALLEAEEARKLLPRKYLIMGGETLTPKLMEKIASLSADCEVLNHYGPTETTVGSLTLRLKEYDWRGARLASIPIGQPIQNTQVYILDQNLDPVPVGVTGELYIAGAGVTAGYLSQPEKTEERFVRNPFSTDAKAKMYRTGDLARYLADGKIEFLGRGDDQVKIRGFRIELGEIEAVLLRQAAVKQAVVLAREDERGDKRLVAYVVLNRESTAAEQSNADGLRASLKNELPDYMVPQSVVLMPKLPLNANGKIDRQALPEPDETSPRRAYVAPHTATETTIVEVWAEVLRRDKTQISADDNFFDLGGHSLLATQVVSRLRRALNVELPLRTLFEFPTVRRLAEQAQQIGTSNLPERPPMVPVGRNQPLPLSFAQQRLWVLDRIDPRNPLYNIPRAIRLKGKLDRKALIDSLNEIVRRHESLRTTFATGKNSEPVQVTKPSLILNVPIIDLSSRAEGEREPAATEIAAEEARTAFDLATGPLLRAKLLELGERDHVLLLTMHHIVSDAWSAGIFFQELSSLYTAFLNGKPSPLPELPIQYADYAAWQRNWLQGSVLEGQLSYWREHLRGAPPLLDLPSDRPRPEVRKFEGAHEPIALEKGVAQEAKAFSQREGTTPFMTLLAAFKALLARYSGQEHIVLGTDIANRTTAETERLIGFFINLLPLHTDLSGDPSFRELVLRVREVALGAYAHQDIPFDKLVEDLQPERSLSHNPIVQALFVMQNIPATQRELPGLELGSLPTAITRSKFDLAVFVRDTAAGIIADWVYSTELFGRKTILRMASHFENLLRDAVSRPDNRLSALEIYSTAEKQERDREKKERKQSQRKKLMTIEPKAVPLAQRDDEP